MKKAILILTMAFALPAWAQSAYPVSESALRKAMAERIHNADSVELRAIQSKLDEGDSGALLICGEVKVQHQNGAGFEPFAAVGFNRGTGEYLLIGTGKTAEMTCNHKF